MSVYDCAWHVFIGQLKRSENVCFTWCVFFRSVWRECGEQGLWLKLLFWYVFSSVMGWRTVLPLCQKNTQSRSEDWNRKMGIGQSLETGLLSTVVCECTWWLLTGWEGLSISSDPRTGKTDFTNNFKSAQSHNMVSLLKCVQTFSD